MGSSALLNEPDLFPDETPFITVTVLVFMLALAAAVFAASCSGVRTSLVLTPPLAAFAASAAALAAAMAAFTSYAAPVLSCVNVNTGAGVPSGAA